MKFIITGTGRCGTVFLAKYLTSAGIPCSHEGIFTPEGINEAREIIRKGEVDTSYVSTHEKGGRLPKWLNDRPVADSSYLAAPFLSEFKDAKTIHVVRNPMKVISSFHYYAKTFRNDVPLVQLPYQKFIYEQLPELPKIKNELTRCVYYVVNWNKLITNQNPNFFLKIEDPKEELLDFIGANKKSDLFDNTKSNSWNDIVNKSIIQYQVKFNELERNNLKDELVRQMKKLGYWYPKFI